MSATKRKHVSTGKRPPGGAGRGAGRHQGTKNALGYGEVKALDVAALRVPEGATEGAKTLAAMGLGRILDVMLERVTSFQAGSVLKAATRVREEVCGPLAQKVEHSGKLALESLTDEQLEARCKAIAARFTTEEPKQEEPAEPPK